MFRSILLIFSSLVFNHCVIAQSSYYNHINYKGDTIKLLTITSPTICDCIGIDYRNKDQKKFCNRSYDYDFMSEEERKVYDDRAEICRNPSICDCANANMNDKGLLKQCDYNFNYEGISSNRLKEIQVEIKKCGELKNIDDLQICDCINIQENHIKKQCDEKFFKIDLSDEEKKNIAIQMQQCVEKTAYKVHITVCDCALQANKDEEIKKACDVKYNISEMDSTEHLNYQNEINYCKNNQVIEEYITSLNLSEDSVFTPICDCMNLSETQTKQKETCINQWNLSSFTSDQLNAYRAIATRCDDKYSTSELSICLCMFEVYTLNDDLLLRKCEQYLETISENDLQNFFSNGMDCFD